ncbi:unnamed protein product [Prorocentrum cordatum]|uniref:PX domain-containing protein n=1 Tax=Prorocentrum cordatum TaxID=2364126 RepID=A0ABN9V163_9DINO|nr:unnamed protein product [Polarella glacialis]
MSWPFMSRMLQEIGDSMKNQALDDKDMPKFVESMASSFLDNVWADVATEIQRGVEDAFVRSDLRELEVQRSRAKKGPVADSCWMAVFYPELRRVVLYHFLPCDKTMFGKLKDPVCLLFYAITCIPLHGVRPLFFLAVFLMLVVPGPPDEFQIINFILQLKGSQFLSSGLIQMSAGSMKYFCCYSRYRDSGDALLKCLDTRGPGEGEAWGLAADYLGSTLLVYSACALLLRLEKTKHAAGRAAPDEQEMRAGGRLRGLVYYDVKCFGASILFLAAITVWNVLLSGAASWWPQMCANVFWCCVLYSVLSLPFFLFTIPGVQTLLTHCDPTGHNAHGACVLWRPLSRKETPAAEGAADPLSGSALQDWHYRMGARLMATLERGREVRLQGGQADNPGTWNYTAMDLFHGIQRRRRSGGSPERRRAERLSTSAASQEGFLDALRRRLATADGEAAGDMQPDLHGTLAPLDSVRFLTEHTHKDPSGRTLHCVQVTPESVGSLDEAESPEPWVLYRYYTDFRELARSLGPEADSLDARLPSRMKVVTRQMRLEREEGLERWLQAVVIASRAPSEEQQHWAGKVAAFLTQRKRDLDVEAQRLRADDDSPASSDDDERRSGGPALSEGDMRHDFGISFRTHHCGDCQVMTRNRGCGRCEMRLCREHFLQHNCSPSATGLAAGPPLLEANLVAPTGTAAAARTASSTASVPSAGPFETFGSLVRAGKETRGVDAESDYKLGDFSRGALSKIKALTGYAAPTEGGRGGGAATSRPSSSRTSAEAGAAGATEEGYGQGVSRGPPSLRASAAANAAGSAAATEPCHGEEAAGSRPPSPWASAAAAATQPGLGEGAAGNGPPSPWASATAAAPVVALGSRPLETSAALLEAGLAPPTETAAAARTASSAASAPSSRPLETFGSLVRAGKETRGVDADSDYRFGDFSRGALSKIKALTGSAAAKADGGAAPSGPPSPRAGAAAGALAAAAQGRGGGGPSPPPHEERAAES